MAASPSMVLDNLVEPEDFSARFIICGGILSVAWFAHHHETRDSLAEPVFECVLVGGGFFEVVGVAAFDDFPEDREHLRKICFVCFTDMHLMLPRDKILLHYII